MLRSVSAHPRFALTALLLLTFVVPGRLRAQSISEGRLAGEIVSTQGKGIAKVQLTLVSQSTGGIVSFKTDFLGRFALHLVAPGTYSMLVELAGYQPVRQRGIRVFAGRTTNLRIPITRRPPPITSVEEIPFPERGEPSTGTAFGQYFNEREMGIAPWRPDITDLSRASIVTAPRDGRWGFAQTAGGLPASESGVVTDGLPGWTIRHPGLLTEPVGTPVYPRGLYEQAQIVTNSADVEWRGGMGSLLSAYGRRGTNQFRFEPYAMVSGKAGLAQEDNPGDSSATSIQVGGVVSGALIKNTAQFVVGVDYQSLEQPSAAPWANDSASFGGASVPLAATIAKVANDSFGRSVRTFTQPTLRTWKGGSGGARLDWQLSKSATKTHNLTGRIAFAGWNEDDPTLGEDVLTGQGTALEARDFSAGITLTSLWLNSGNEFRFGHRTVKRDWTGAALPTTYMVGEAAGVGAQPGLPGEFKGTSFDLAETFHGRLSRTHLLKIGAQFTANTWTQTYQFGSGGIFQFGNLDRFGNAEGVFFQTVPNSPSTDFKTTEYHIFGQDTWQVDRGIVVTFGLGWYRQKLPYKSAQLPVTSDPAFVGSFNRQNRFLPNDAKNFEPRFGLVWDVDDKQEWIVRAGGSLSYGNLDLATVSEAIVADGDGLRVRRGTGTFTSWPGDPDSVTLAPFVGNRITFFDSLYRLPRAAKADMAITHTFRPGINVTLAGAYHHTDYILRRTDINLPGSPLGTTQEGRPVYGTLLQQGGLVTAQPGSNRRFSQFDMVSELASTGFSDYYEAGIEVARRALTGVSFSAGYTWSKTRDNWSAAPANGDPADQLNPFPNDPIGDQWIKGRSDYDIPHRARFAIGYRSPGKWPIGLGARYRFRSGLPFTPGLRPGVDINGDGSGRNDPAYLNSSIPGMSSLVSNNDCLQGVTGLVERNSCREQANHALDLSGSVGIPFGSGGATIALTIDAFNVVATETGLVDRAVVLIDPTGTLSTDALGNVTVPLIANPNFGKLLVRRGEGRVIRIGLRMGYRD